MTGHSIPYIRAELQLDSVGLKKKTKNARTFIIGPTADTLLCMISSLPSHLVILPGLHFNS